MVFLEACRDFTARMRADEEWSGKKWPLQTTFWSVLAFGSFTWIAIIFGIANL